MNNALYLMPIRKSTIKRVPLSSQIYIFALHKSLDISIFGFLYFHILSQSISLFSLFTKIIKHTLTKIQKFCILTIEDYKY